MIMCDGEGIVMGRVRRWARDRHKPFGVTSNQLPVRITACQPFMAQTHHN